jgi:serine/threonine-protein kinase
LTGRWPGSAICPDIVARLLAHRDDDPQATLSWRELDVLALMAAGRSNQAICAHLGLFPEPDDHRRVLAVLAYLPA